MLRRALRIAHPLPAKGIERGPGRLPVATAVGIASAALAVLQQVHHLTDVSVPAFVAEALAKRPQKGEQTCSHR